MKVLALVAAIFAIAAAQQRCGTWKCQLKLVGLDCWKSVLNVYL